MKIFGIVGTTLLLLLLGTGVSVFAQDQRDDAKPQAQEEEKAKQEDKSVKQEEKKDEKVREEDKTARHDEKEAQNDHREAAAQEHHEQVRRIPDEKFRAHFGHEHRFRIGHPVIVEGRPRFQYGGYSFVAVDPWPVGWAYTDEVYVDFIDGVYYLINPVHPGVRIVVSVM